MRFAYPVRWVGIAGMAIPNPLTMKGNTMPVIHHPNCLSLAVRSALENARDAGMAYEDATKVAMEWALGFLNDGMSTCHCDRPCKFCGDYITLDVHSGWVSKGNGVYCPTTSGEVLGHLPAPIAF